VTANHNQHVADGIPSLTQRPVRKDGFLKHQAPKEAELGCPYDVSQEPIPQVDSMFSKSKGLLLTHSLVFDHTDYYMATQTVSFKFLVTVKHFNSG
jgi:hypothetical protein